MKPLPFVWPYALIFWGVYFWTFWPEFRVLRGAQRSGNKTDAKSLHVILVGLQVAYIGAFLLAFVRATQFHTSRVLLFYVGIVFMLAGSLLRRHCFRMLGSSFTGDVRVRPDQEIVTRGAYSLLRHPSYTAAIILNVGMCLALGSWASLILLVVMSFIVYSYRISVEERALVAAIGQPYREFMKTRKRLIPFVY